MTDTNIAYCMKCKQKREIANPEKITMKNNRTAIRGICSICGTKMFRILGTKKAETTEGESFDSANE